MAQDNVCSGYVQAGRSICADDSGDEVMSVRSKLSDDEEDADYLALDLFHHLPPQMGAKLLKTLRAKEKANQELNRRNKVLAEMVKNLGHENHALSERLRDVEYASTIAPVAPATYQSHEIAILKLIQGKLEKQVVTLTADKENLQALNHQHEMMNTQLKVDLERIRRELQAAQKQNMQSRQKDRHLFHEVVGDNVAAVAGFAGDASRGNVGMKKKVKKKGDLDATRGGLVTSCDVTNLGNSANSIGANKALRLVRFDPAARGFDGDICEAGEDSVQAFSQPGELSTSQCTKNFVSTRVLAVEARMAASVQARNVTRKTCDIVSGNWDGDRAKNQACAIANIPVKPASVMRRRKCASGK
eukprot:TRINITY_DN13934_c0_g1_i1.p1 TRINITY_DN13934_c0_g1~~TRINITY_DN13934_c0_g1_i1.p1  ORF type:complete len:384 (+),score=84.75 TRINITY_DN13934_c0_g1_i1:77-1153(+)